jgi:sugar lactone lactonase YvrE
MNITNLNSELYFKKYLKYKTKYVNVKAQLGGVYTTGEFLINVINPMSIIRVGTVSVLPAEKSFIKSINVGTERTSSIIFDKDGNFVICNTTYGLKVIRSSGSLIKQIGAIKGNPAFVPNKRGIAFDSSDKLYVTDPFNNQVMVLEYSSGQTVRIIGKGIVQYPISVAVNSRYVCVLDSDSTGTDDIKVFDITDGRYLKTISEHGRNDTQLKCDGSGNIVFDNNGYIVVTDVINNCIKVFDIQSGRLIRIIKSSPGTPTNQCITNPVDIAFDNGGHIIIISSHTNTQQIQVFKYDTGEWCRTIQTNKLGDKGEGALDTPNSVLIDQDGHVIVCDDTSFLKFFK